MADTPLSPDTIKLDGPFSHDFVHTRGLRLHIATAGKIGDPLVLLLHDAFGAWFDFQDVLAPLAAEGFRVAAVDLRGYGLSDKPPAGPEFSARTLASDIAGLIPALGYDSATLVGCDTGGTVAWTLATTHPQRVDALVSIASAHPVDLRRAVAARPWEFFWILLRQLSFRRIGKRRKAVTREAVRFLSLNTAASFHRSEAYQRTAELRRTATHIGSVTPAIVHTSRVLLAPPSLKQLGARVTAPTLMFHAPQSLWRGVNERSGRRVTEGVYWESATVPGTKNLPHMEAPQAFVEKLSLFLKRNAACPPGLSAT